MADLKVLLIGGSSGVGKTVVAAQIASRLGMTWGQVDDFRLVIERITAPEHQPALHAFFCNFDTLAPEELVHQYAAVARVVSNAIEIVIANHVATGAPIVLEGDTILPEVAAQRVFANLDVNNQVRAVFVVELDAAWIRHNILARGRGTHNATQLKRRVQFSWLYGQWLQQEAGQYSLPVLAARPLETLMERILTAIQP